MSPVCDPSTLLSHVLLHTRHFSRFFFLKRSRLWINSVSPAGNTLILFYTRFLDTCFPRANPTFENSSSGRPRRSRSECPLPHLSSVRSPNGNCLLLLLSTHFLHCTFLRAAVVWCVGGTLGSQAVERRCSGTRLLSDSSRPPRSVLPAFECWTRCCSRPWTITRLLSKPNMVDAELMFVK